MVLSFRFILAAIAGLNLMARRKNFHKKVELALKQVNMRILIVNGPNLNLVGEREPEKYGNQSFEDYFTQLKQRFSEHELAYYQSNVEGELINCLQAARKQYDALVVNAGGYTHTSVALGDTLAAIKLPMVEVHISNIFARESFRQHSYLAQHVKGVISGFGLSSYELAIYWLVKP